MLKRHQEKSLVDFYNCLPSAAYSHLKWYAHGLMSVFDSTCGKRHCQVWNLQNLIRGETLQSILIGNTNLNPN